MAALSVDRPADGKVDRVGQAAGASGGAQSRVAGHSTGYDQAAGADRLGRRGGAGEQFVDHGVLKRSQ